MSTFELRPSPGATETLVRKKAARTPVRSSLKRFSCPCGCGRSRWFSQPRSLRTATSVAS
jgi:hypothetical protein